ncbi:hypothetical protein BC829DRAFT_402351 [Chytridium lagenaria]|nr:hypothetical protein BC829DRAFT_402351 [Chytridium lagenaria]
MIDVDVEPDVIIVEHESTYPREKATASYQRQKAKDKKRKVIKHPTSITFPKVGYVVDSGLQFYVSYHPVLNVQRTKVQTTTKASEIQRKGRAGRLGPGVCYRLYSHEDSEKFPDQIFSDSEQLNLDVLHLLDMYGNEARFVSLTKNGQDQVSSDGRLALDLSRMKVIIPMARF